MLRRGFETSVYLKPLQKCEKKQIWFSSVPIGHNKLQGMVKSIMEKGRVSGHFTNIPYGQQPYRDYIVKGLMIS